MRIIRPLTALTALVVSTSVLGLPAGGKDVASTRELVQLCSASADDPAYAAAMGFCLGYIDAALDYHAALTSGKKFEAIVCPGPGLTRQEVVVVFLDWSSRNPQQLDTGAPVENVMRAVYEKWPCSGQ